MASTMVDPVAPWMAELRRATRQPQTGDNAFIPPADLLVDDDGLTIYLDVPGLHPDDLQIELDNDLLTIRGERSMPYPPPESGRARRVERGFGRFERGIRVPPELEPESIDASLADGVLTLRLAKPPRPHPRRIQIEAEADGSRHDEGSGHDDASG